MKQIIFFFILLGVLITTTYADILVEPKDLGEILKKVESHSASSTPGLSAAHIVMKNGEILFIQKPGATDIATHFSDESTTIIKQINLTNNANNDGYAFSAMLDNEGQPYKHLIKQVNGQDALVFFNKHEIFVYTQTAAPNGAIELKEWIYARKPNGPHGSEWKWLFKGAMGDWPLTLGLTENGEAAIYRNLPFSGIPIAAKAKSQYILDAVVQFSNGDHVEKHFPFHEIVSAIPPSLFWTKEGTQRQANISIANSSVINPRMPKPTGDVNIFNDWDKYWQSFFNVSVAAKPEEYPLLIDPSLVIIPLPWWEGQGEREK